MGRVLYHGRCLHQISLRGGVTARPLRSALFLGCKRSDDFLEARLAAEQAPLGQEIQLSVVNNPEPERPVEKKRFHVFAGKFVLAHPSGGEGEILDLPWRLPGQCRA